MAIVAGTAVGDTSDRRPWQLGLALLLALPASLGALPVIYLVGALAWNITDADTTGTRWPVVLVYTAIVGAAAALNVVVLDEVRATLKRARARARAG